MVICLFNGDSRNFKCRRRRRDVNLIFPRARASRRPFFFDFNPTRVSMIPHTHGFERGQFVEMLVFPAYRISEIEDPTRIKRFIAPLERQRCAARQPESRKCFFIRFTISDSL